MLMYMYIYMYVHGCVYMYMHCKPLNLEMILTLAALTSEAVHDFPYLYTMYLYSKEYFVGCTKATKMFNFLSTQKNKLLIIMISYMHVHVDHL